MRKLFLIFLILIFLSGCATTHGTKINTTNIPKIEKGKTTKQEVLMLFGEPLSKQLNANGTETWTYEFTKGAKDPLQLILSTMTVGLVSIATYEIQTLNIIFNVESICIDFDYSTKKEYGGT